MAKFRAADLRWRTILALCAGPGTGTARVIWGRSLWRAGRQEALPAPRRAIAVSRMGERVRGSAKGDWTAIVVRMTTTQPPLFPLAELARGFALATVVGAFLGLIGPFGTYMNGPAQVRVVYWVSAFWLSFGIYGLLVRLAIRAAVRLSVPTWIGVLAGAIVAGAPMTLACRLIAQQLWPFLGRQNPLVWYFQGLLLATPIVLGYAALNRERLGLRRSVVEGAEVVAVRPDVGGGGPPLLSRLPRALGSNILCLQMEDHYVRVHTPAGSELILMTLREAITELGGLEGLRVHRSWWVGPGGGGRARGGRSQPSFAVKEWPRSAGRPHGRGFGARGRLVGAGHLSQMVAP
jgi:LytTr DNA-binding domain